MFLSPVLDIIELCKTKNYEDVSEFVFILLFATGSSYWADFTRKFDIIALVPNFVGNLLLGLILIRSSSKSHLLQHFHLLQVLAVGGNIVGSHKLDINYRLYTNMDSGRSCRRRRRFNYSYDRYGT